MHRRRRPGGRRRGGGPAGRGAAGGGRARLLAGAGHGGRAARPIGRLRCHGRLESPGARGLPRLRLRGARSPVRLRGQRCGERPDRAARRTCASRPAHPGRRRLRRRLRPRLRPGHRPAASHPRRPRGHRPGSRPRGALGLRQRARRLRGGLRPPGRRRLPGPAARGLLGHELVRLLHRHRVRRLRPRLRRGPGLGRPLRRAHRRLRGRSPRCRLRLLPRAGHGGCRRRPAA